MRSFLARVIIIAPLIINQASCQARALQYAVQKTFHIASPGGWDYIAVSPSTDYLYVSHSTQVNILNKTSGDSVGVIKGTTGVHGIAFVPSLGKGFISNGRLNNVFVFDLKTNVVLDSIRTGENPDAIFYEPFSKKIITCNGRSKDASIIDPVTHKVVATIPLNGKPETAVSDGAGMMYVDIEDKNEVVAIDARNMKVLRRFKLGSGEEPAGLAIDLSSKMLFIGCGNRLLVMMNTSGNIIQTLPIGDHCDGVVFDEGNAYASNGEGTISIVNKSGGKNGKYEVENIPTQRGARTIAVDPRTHLLYLPTADFEPPASGANERPKMIPGSFRVLVIGKKQE